MPPERQPAQKRRHLPFKPPSRASASSAGPSRNSTTAKPSTSTKKTSTSKPNATPSSSNSKPKSTTTSHLLKSAKPSSSRHQPSPSESATSSDSSPSDRTRTSRSPPSEGEPDYILAEIIHKDTTATEDVISSEPLIPQKLLTRLLHHHFRNEKTKIAKDANAVVAKYIDVYVREAVARAAFERAEAGAGAGGVEDGFLEVEDLEKMGPQLAMDF